MWDAVTQNRRRIERMRECMRHACTLFVIRGLCPSKPYRHSASHVLGCNGLCRQPTIVVLARSLRSFMKWSMMAECRRVLLQHSEDDVAVSVLWLDPTYSDNRHDAFVSRSSFVATRSQQVSHISHTVIISRASSWIVICKTEVWSTADLAFNEADYNVINMPRFHCWLGCTVSRPRVWMDANK